MLVTGFDDRQGCGYVLRTGRIAIEGRGPELATHEDLFGHYIGGRPDA